MQENSGKNNWVGVLIIIAIVVGIFFLVSGGKKNSVANVPAPASSKGVADLAVFKDGLAAAGIAGDTIGFHGFSPNGKYFFMSVFDEGATPANQPYLIKVSDGTVIKLPGLPERVIDDNRVVALYSDEGTVLYRIATGESATYDLGENVFFGTLSPDGKTYIANTAQGLRKVDIASGIVTSFTKNQYDGAYAWSGDSNRILGFQQTNENLFEAGKGRRLGWWDMSTADFIPLETNIDSRVLRLIEWVVPGRVARVNAGWDDGSHDYLLDVENNRVIDIGDTSGSLMGGVVADETTGLFAVVGGDDAAEIGSKVLLYDGMEKKHELTLPTGYFRQSIQIVSQEQLIYLRKQWGTSGVTAQQLVSLDLVSGTETVLQELPATAYAYLSLSPDKKTWVLSTGATFMTGAIK